MKKRFYSVEAGFMKEFLVN